MFTKEQLDQLKEVVRAETEPLKQDISGLKQEVAAIVTGLQIQGKTMFDLHQGQVRIEKKQDHLQTDMNYITSAQEALRAGLDDLREKQENTKAELKTDIQDLGAIMDKSRKSHERRIENLEEHTGTQRTDIH